MREMVNYVRADRQVAVQVPAQAKDTEVWTGPVQELRARLRDESRDGRVKPFMDVLDSRGCPRGHGRFQVYLTPQELKRQAAPAPRPRWPWVLGGLSASLAALAGAGYWAFTATAAALAEATGAALVGVLLLAGGIVLLLGSRSTTIVEVLVKVRR